MRRMWLQCRVAFPYFPQTGNNSSELSGYPEKHRLTMLPVQKPVLLGGGQGISELTKLRHALRHMRAAYIDNVRNGRCEHDPVYSCRI